MAKKTAPVASTEADNLDDLLGPVTTTATETAPVKDAPVVLSQEDKDRLKQEAKDKKAAEKAAAKAEKEANKKPRVLKGQMVSFTTKGTGETITGMGVLYYVVRFNGKLHYKEASQVTVLPEPEATETKTEA